MVVSSARTLLPWMLIAVGWCAPRASQAACGDAVLDADEMCDLGIGNEVGIACTTRCTPPACGDGFLDVGEACDDGNVASQDGCNAECVDEATPLWSTALDLSASDASSGESFAAVVHTEAGYIAVGSLWRDSDEEGGTPEFAPLVAGFADDGAHTWSDLPLPARGASSANAALVRDDALWVAGTVADAEGILRPTLWRYLLDGTRTDTIDLAALQGAATIQTLVMDADGRVFSGGAHAAPSTPETGWIGELDLDAGTLLWWVDTAERRRVSDLAPMHDGRIAAAGWRSNVLWAGVVDDAGVASWTQELPNEYPIQERFGSAVAVADDDTIYVAGYSSFYVTNDYDDRNGWLGAFSPDGAMSWMRDVSGDGLLEDFRDVLVVDGGPVAIGRVGTTPLVASGTSDVDVWVQRFDTDGEGTERWLFDGAMHHIDGGSAAVLEPDGGLVVVGSTTTAFVGSDAWIARVRPDATTRANAPRSRLAPVRRAANSSPRAGAARATTLYLDFDGGTLRPGMRGDLGELPCIDGTVPYAGLAVDTQQAQAIADRVTTVMDPYGVRVRWGEPLPPHLPRTTVMLGGEAVQFGLDPSTSGYSCVVDCTDTWQWDLAFAFAGAAATIANTAAHEAGHTWGLDHVVDMAQLMYPLGATVSAGWGDDACVGTSEETSAVLCGPTHARWCDDGLQNSHAELLAAFGPGQTDVSPPEVSLAIDAEVIAEGEPARIDVTYEDDAGLPGLRLRVPELGWERVVADGDTSFSLPLPRGRYTIIAEVIDHAEQSASAMLEVMVGDVDGADDTGDGTTGTGEGDASSSEGTTGDPGAVTPGEGCGCRTRGGEFERSAWVVWLLGFATVRRRDQRRRNQRRRTARPIECMNAAARRKGARPSSRTTSPV